MMTNLLTQVAAALAQFTSESRLYQLTLEKDGDYGSEGLICLGMQIVQKRIIFNARTLKVVAMFANFDAAKIIRTFSIRAQQLAR